MSLKMKLYLVLFAVFFCAVFAFTNPALLADLDDGNFTEGEVFIPAEGEFDFNAFTMKSFGAKNYTVKFAESGHVQFVDDTGERTINMIEWDKMTSAQKNSRKSFIDNELRKESWTVNGVDVHEIEFFVSENLYSAAVKDTSTGRLIYLSTPDDHETADMINSIRFRG